MQRIADSRLFVGLSVDESSDDVESTGGPWQILLPSRMTWRHKSRKAAVVLSIVALASFAAWCFLGSRPRIAAPIADHHLDKTISVHSLDEASTDSLMGQAKTLKNSADALKESAEHLQSQVHDKMQTVHETLKTASDQISDANDDTSKASKLEQKAAKLQQQADTLHDEAHNLKSKAAQEKLEAEQAKTDADQMSGKADTMVQEAAKDRQNALHTENEALDKVAATRVCLDLPGVKLKGNSPLTLEPIVGHQNISRAAECREWCKKHNSCKQSVFISETKKCDLFGEVSDEPEYFRDRWPWYNSSYCGAKDEKDGLMEKLQKVFKKKPWVPPPHNCSWADENCGETHCCANVCAMGNWQFTKCDWYTCYKQDDYFSGCRLGEAPFGWNGTVLGHHPNTEIAQAQDGWLIQGTKLFCFAVVMWKAPPEAGWQSSEAELANNLKQMGRSIMQCDDHAFFDGLPTGSEHNIQSFIHAWKKVKDDGRWRRNDWTVKVDADAVFFPNHLRSKILYNFKTPQGSAVYLRNTFYKFQFLGALEVLTREAVELYFKRGWECEGKVGQQGGEDYWLKSCLEGIGVNYQTDTALLHDKYAADENCGDPNAVAFHFYKKVSDWNACWEVAKNSWNSAHPA